MYLVELRVIIVREFCTVGSRAKALGIFDPGTFDHDSLKMEFFVEMRRTKYYMFCYIGFDTGLGLLFKN